MELIPRREYLDFLEEARGTQVIKVISGVRRCGKSTLLELFQARLRDEGVAPERIVSINFEDMDFKALRDPEALHDYVTSRLVPDELTYVFLDEVQNVADFPRVADSLYIREGVDLYLTGSNSSLLSGTLATLLSGRYVEVAMLPLSLAEFAEAAGGGSSPAELYGRYLSVGSFPYAVELEGRPGVHRNYLQGIYDSVLVKDIMDRREFRDPLLLRSVTDYVYDNIGNELTSNGIAGGLTAAGRKTDYKTVERYLSALVESYLVYRVPRLNVKGKQLLRGGAKYYGVDLALRRILLGSEVGDYGRELENVVFLELLRRGLEVRVGKVGPYEVDFVARGRTGTAYYQVAASVLDEATLERELRPLRMIDDHFPKVLLTLDALPPATYDGIVRMNALDWLLGR